MIVSWNWLKKYAPLEWAPAAVAERLTMSGLNLEKLVELGSDTAIDLDVTSNRPDCLGHLGVAREVGVLFGVPVQIPEAQPVAQGAEITAVAAVQIAAPELCQRYTARLIRGVRIGPSPAWLQDLLLAIGVSPVNNVVDCTNFVMFECSQPIHAFDFARLRGGRIVVRQPLPGETLTAIDHRLYPLEPGMCVIADAERAVALGGVMGGAESEVSESTREVLIESAWFDPQATRNTARKLNLHSPASYRFERGVDWQGADWASRRCCELILQTAGGTLAEGRIDVGTPPLPRAPIRFRFAQVPRVLGIDIPRERGLAIFQGLGLTVLKSSTDDAELLAPSWRRDLEREIDLVEEIGRLHGYEHVPDNVAVPMAASYRPASSRVLDRVRRALTACRFDEAMTPSLVPELWSNSFSPWTQHPPLISNQPMLGVLEKASQNIGPVHCVRRSLLPSLLEAKRINEYRSNEDVELFEIAKVYLPQTRGIPRDPLHCGLVSSREFSHVKGALEVLLRVVNPAIELSTTSCNEELFDQSQSAQIWLNGQPWGWLGKLSPPAQKLFGLRQPAVAAEVNLEMLEPLAVMIPKYSAISEFPPVSRDFNFVVANEISWARLEKVVRAASGECLERIEYRETFRDESKDGAGTKRLLLSVTLRSRSATLSGDQLEAISQQIVGACREQLAARLVT